MERRTFRAMGTEIELLVDADGRRRRARRRRGRVPPARGAPLALPPDSELSRLNRDGALDAGPDLAARRRARARRARADRRPLRPDRARRARRRRLRPDVRRHRRRTAPAAPAPPRLRRRACASTARGSSSSRRPARPRRHRQGLRGRPRRRAARARRPVPRQRRRRHRRPRRLPGRSASRPPTGDDARAHRAAALATSGRDRRRWRRGGRELHHLIDPRDRPPGRDRPPPRHRRRRRRRRGRGARRRRSSSPARERAARPTRGIPACSSPTTAARCSPEGSHEERPDLLDARARERADRVRAADAVRARRAGRQVAAVRPRGEGRGGHRRPPLPRAARRSARRAARRRARARRDGAHPPRRAARPGPRRLPAARGRARRRSRPSSLVLVVVSFSLRRRIGVAQLAPAALGDLRRSSPLATAHGLTAGTDSSQPWAFGLYLGAVGAVAFATAWRALRPTRTPVTIHERST